VTRHHVTCAACGLHIHAATLFDAWQLFDRHVDQKHGRSFPLGAVRVMPGRGNGKTFARRPPVTPQGGQ